MLWTTISPVVEVCRSSDGGVRGHLLCNSSGSEHMPTQRNPFETINATRSEATRRVFSWCILGNVGRSERWVVVVGGSRPITVKDHELSRSRSLTLSARFVAIKDSRPHLARLLLITHRNNKRSQAEIADASFH